MQLDFTVLFILIISINWSVKPSKILCHYYAFGFRYTFKLLFFCLFPVVFILLYYFSLLIPYNYTLELRNKFKGTGHGTTEWFQIGKGVRQGCILSSCLFSLYAEYIMRNAGLEEAQDGIKISRRNINNLRYADDTTLIRTKEPLDESERGEWKCWLKTQHWEN